MANRGLDVVARFLYKDPMTANELKLSFVTPNQLFEASLKLVDSKSIREWAQTERNKPLWLEICNTAISKGRANSSDMAAYMVAVAIGL